MYGAEHGAIPGLDIAAVATAAVSGGYVDPHHVRRVVGGVEAPTAEAASVVCAAGPAGVRGFSSLEYVAAGFPSRRLGVFSTLDGTLGSAKLQSAVSQRTPRGEQEIYVFGLSTGHGPEQVG